MGAYPTTSRCSCSPFHLSLHFHYNLSLFSPDLSKKVMQGKHQLLIDGEGGKKLINGHRAGLMVGIMPLCLTVNGRDHWRSCLTSPHPATDRQQPTTDSDAWDPLSHIDHPWRVHTDVGTLTNILQPDVLVIVLLPAASPFSMDADVSFFLFFFSLLLLIEM